jgi:hypothetical protein
MIKFFFSFKNVPENFLIVIMPLYIWLLIHFVIFITFLNVSNNTLIFDRLNLGLLIICSLNFRFIFLIIRFIELYLLSIIYCHLLTLILIYDSILLIHYAIYVLLRLHLNLNFELGLFLKNLFILKFFHWIIRFYSFRSF